MSSNYAKNSQNVGRRAAKPSANMYRDDTPASPFRDDEEYVLVSSQSYDDMPPFGGSSDSHYAEADRPRFSHEPLMRNSDQFSKYEPYHHQLPTDATRRPLTSNELDPVERAALVKQSRKLNKILGTTPHISENTRPSTSYSTGTTPHISENIRPSTSRSTPGKLQRRGTLAGSDIRLDRSASMATLSSPPLEPPAGSQWSKPAGSSLVATSSPNANVKVPVLQLNLAPSSGQPIEPLRARRLSDSSIASSFLSMTSTHRSRSGRMVSRRQDTTDSFDDSQEIPPSSRNTQNTPRSNMYMPVSPTSPGHVSDATRRQQTRARMAKLQQIMGESVPSELVMGTSANDKIRRRRLSMESPTTPTSVAAKSLKHKRSKSLWRKDVDDTLEFDSAPENSSGMKGHSKSKSREMPPIEDLLLKQLPNPMNEKQKALNVKRALKMAAVFGVPPPQTLYQDIPGPGSRGSMDPSVSSQSLASLAYMLDHDRDSLYDLLANTAGSDSESDDEPVEWPYEHKPRTDSLPEGLSKRAPTNVPVGAAKLSIAGTTLDMCPPTPPFGSHSRASSKPTSSRGPPLVYSTSVMTLDEGDNYNEKQQAASSRRPSSALDHQLSSRRRRAKKLSRFFGVGYNDLFNTLVYEEGLGNRQDPALDHSIPPLPKEFSDTNTATAATSDPSANRLAAPPSAYRSTGRGGTVLVQTDNGKKATVLRTSANIAADVDASDLGEMMARLRALRA